MSASVRQHDKGTSVRDLIAELYDSGEVDPHVVAGKLVAAADEEQMRELATAGALYLARRHIHGLRSATPTSDQQHTDAQLGSVAGGGRWADAAAASWNLTIPYEVEGDWKQLGDCTADEVDAIAADYADRAARNAARAERFRDLAAKVREAGAATVGELFAGRAAA